MDNNENYDENKNCELSKDLYNKCLDNNNDSSQCIDLFNKLNECYKENNIMVKEKIKGSHFNFRRILYTVKPIKAGDEITSYYTLLK